MDEFIKKYLGEFIAAMLAGFAAWFYQRKMNKAQVESAILENSNKIMSMYRAALDDLEKQHKKQIDYLNKQINDLRQRIIEVEHKHKECEMKNKELEQRIKGLMNKINS